MLMWFVSCTAALQRVITTAQKVSYTHYRTFTARSASHQTHHTLAAMFSVCYPLGGAEGPYKPVPLDLKTVFTQVPLEK